MGTDHAPFMPASECMYGSKNLNTFSAYINTASNQYIRIVWVFKELWPGADQISWFPSRGWPNSFFTPQTFLIIPWGCLMMQSASQTFSLRSSGHYIFTQKVVLAIFSKQKVPWPFLDSNHFYILYIPVYIRPCQYTYKDISNIGTNIIISFTFSTYTRIHHHLS